MKIVNGIYAKLEDFFMSIVERLQSIVKSRGTNFKQLERDCGIGNGTVRRWDDKSPGLDKVCKVADFLQISLDYLVYGQESAPVESPSCLGVQLTQSENDLISMLRALPLRDRDDLFDFVQLKYKKHVERKNEQSTYTSCGLTDESKPA